MLEGFSKTLEKFCPNITPLTIALSGGSDSLALLHLAHQAFPQSHLIALTVDHQLRKDSSTEAQQVAQWMQTLGIEHHILTWQHGDVTGNLQASARHARYQLMTNWCKAHNRPSLLLGHTQDDQAETIAFMQQRGAGPVGLAGMSAIREANGITLLRPILGHQRNELQAWLREQSIDWVSDPSNNNTDFTRIKIRQALTENPARKAELLQLGREMSIERMEIEKLHAKFVETHITPQQSTLECSLLAFLMLDEAQAAYSLGRMICHVGGKDYPPRYAKRLHCLEKLKKGSESKFTLGLCQLKVVNEKLTLSPEKDNQVFGVKALVTSPFSPIFQP